jgi:hypothetical protein
MYDNHLDNPINRRLNLLFDLVCYRNVCKGTTTSNNRNHFSLNVFAICA